MQKAKCFTIPALYIAMFLAVSGLRVLNLSSVEVREFPDTKGYTNKASLPLFSCCRFGPLGWWMLGRSPTVPLFYKLAGNVPHSIAILQVSLSILSWGFLAMLVSRALQTDWLKLAVFLIILLFSLSDDIMIWDGFLLSDSISLSLMALLVGSWLWLLEKWDWRKAALMLIVAFLWAFSRDTNAWVIFILACLLITVGSLSRSRHYLFIAAVFVMFFTANEISQNYSRRWVTAFINVVARRILPNPEWTAYFAQRGMPVTPALMSLSGQLAWSQDWIFYKDPALKEFRDWVYRSGKSSYTRFLLAQPAITIQEPLRNIEGLVAPKLSYYGSPGFSPILTGALAEVIYFKKWALLWVWASGIIVGSAFVIAIQENKLRWLVPLTLVILAYPHAAVAWHGDPMDIGRHALQAGVHFRLGLWMLLLFAGDMMLAHITRGKFAALGTRTP